MKDEELDMLIANVEYEPQQLKDYITNLQEENENIISESLAYDLAVARVKELEYRIDKAIEYINENGYIDLNGYDLLEILQGSDEEWTKF